MPNKCDENCPAFWSNYSSYIGDGDCGCLIRDIEKYEDNCRLPYFIRVIRAKLSEKSTNRFWKKCANKMSYNKELHQAIIGSSASCKFERLNLLSGITIDNNQWVNWVNIESFPFPIIDELDTKIKNIGAETKYELLIDDNMKTYIIAEKIVLEHIIKIINKYVNSYAIMQKDEIRNILPDFNNAKRL